MLKKTVFLVGIISTYFAAVHGAVVTGLVTDTAGNLIQGAVVTLTPIDTGARSPSIDTTDNVGSFRFDSVTAARYPAVFQIRAVKEGYNASSPQRVTIDSSNSAIGVNIELIPRVPGVRISGNVTDSVTGSPIEGALIVLRPAIIIQDQVARQLDSAITDQNGVYALDSVQPGSYAMLASADGYVPKTATNVRVGNSPIIRNFELAQERRSEIVGTVASDSSSGPGIRGATVILSRRSAVGGNLTPIDTISTDSTGWYIFSENITSGLSYSINASATGYTGRSVTVTKSREEVDTVDITLTRIPRGDLLVRVYDAEDTSGLSGASVVAIHDNERLTGITDSNGMVVFEEIIAGTFSVTASAQGFAAGTGSGTVPRNGADTVNLYLEATSQGTKVLKGRVTDSASGNAVIRALVVLEVRGSGSGSGTTLIFFDSTDTNGNYAIVGIPINRVTGTVTAAAVNYETYTNAQTTMGQMNQADTATLNIRMTPLTVDIIPMVRARNSMPAFTLSTGGVLRLSNTHDAGRVRVFAMNGRLLYECVIQPHTSCVTIPRMAQHSSSSFIVSLTQKDRIYNKKFVRP
ncbi:MAG: carboxypeptidase regulatory-like domain-containing protein [Chitinispirillaceae bacterium]|nr:carboxypeptidase regulatory-like domain-containing protein [Chitinispirillaceae bacterium]